MKVPFLHITFLSVLALFAACGSEKATENGPDVLSVRAIRVEGRPFSSEVVTTANLLANEQVQLMAPMSGQVLSIHFKEGQVVRKGDLLVHLDDRNWQAQLAGVKSELETAERDLERKKALEAIGGSSQVELDNARTLVEKLKSQLKQLQVSIDLARVNAPFTGRIGMRNFSHGAFLNQGDIISTLTDLDQLKVDFTLPQTHQKNLSVGTNINVKINADTLKATVYAIDPVIDTQTRTIRARAYLKQPKNRSIMPGTFAEVILKTDFVSDALLIPSQSVVPSITEQTVYLYKNGKAVRRTIEMGARTADLVQVLSGLQPGDTVLTTGLLTVKDGMELNLQAID